MRSARLVQCSPCHHRECAPDTTRGPALGISVYLTIAHYTATVTLACPQTATVNYEKGTTSAQSQFLGAPVAVLGQAYFAALLPLCTPWDSIIRLCAGQGV